MSSWHDFGLACDLRRDTPSDVVDLLKYMSGAEDEGYTPPTKDSVPFDFEGYRSEFEYVRKATSSLFPGAFGITLHRTHRHLPGGESGDRYTLSFRCPMKDDQFVEDSWTFIKWLAPYTESGGIAYDYTAYRCAPTLVYFRDGKAEYYEVELRHVGSLE